MSAEERLRAELAGSLEPRLKRKQLYADMAEVLKQLALLRGVYNANRKLKKERDEWQECAGARQSKNRKLQAKSDQLQAKSDRADADHRDVLAGMLREINRLKTRVAEVEQESDEWQVSAEKAWARVVELEKQMLEKRISNLGPTRDVVVELERERDAARAELDDLRANHDPAEVRRDRAVESLREGRDTVGPWLMKADALLEAIGADGGGVRS